MAGAGYDVSASRSDSVSQAANQTSPTIFNFGGGDVSGGWYGQSNTPSSTSVAARNAGPVTGENSGGGEGLFSGAQGGGAFSNVNWPMVGAAAAGLVAVGLLVYLAHKSGK